MKIRITILLLLVFCYTGRVFSAGSDYRYFKLFFDRNLIQNKSDIKNELKYPDSSHHYYQYSTLDDFSTVDGWKMNINHDMASVKNIYGSADADKPEEYLHWKKMTLSDRNYVDVLPHSAQKLEDKTILGIRSFFISRTHHSFSISPAKPLYFSNRARVKTIDMFVFSTKRDYDMYVEVMDFKDQKHRIFLGNLNYTGWKRLHVDLKQYHIPDIPLEEALNTKLRLVRIIIQTKTMQQGFFGVWLSELGYTYAPSINDYSGSPLVDEFKWESSTSNGIGSGANSSSKTPESSNTATDQ